MQRHDQWPIEAALRLCLRYPVFPCGNDKRPTVNHGFKEASRDPDVVRAMWQDRPGELIGVPTGAVSGIDALDIDPRHGGDEWLAANADSLPRTRRHQTRSGGQHLIFRHAEGVRNSAGKIALGVDTRGDGGFIIFWPAHGYRVETALIIADWPRWLLQTLVPPPQAASRQVPLPNAGDGQLRRYAVGALRSAVEKVASTSEGGRNNLLNKECFSLCRFIATGALTAHEIADGLAAAAHAAGLSQREIAATLSSALRAGGAA
jgi:hypothetical protein